MDRRFYESINAQIDRHLSNIESQQVTVEMSDDMAAFKDVHVGLNGWIHPTLDIAVSTIRPGDGRWLCLRGRVDGEEKAIATIGARVFDQTSVAHLLHTRLIWGDRRHAEQLGPVSPIRYVWSDDLEKVSGRLVYGGGAFLDRSFKGNELGRSMAALMHAMALRIWNPDFFFNLMKADKLTTKVPPQRFGYRHTTVIFDADTKPEWGPVTPKELVNWKSRAEEMENYPAIAQAA